jgi:hypothetical protein
MHDGQWQRAAGYQIPQALVLPLRSGELVHRVHHRFEQYNGWVSASDVSANRTQSPVFTDPVFMHNVWGCVMRAIHNSVVSSEFICRWFHSRISRHVKYMQAFRSEPSPQGFPNSESWKGFISTPFDQSGGKVSGYRMNGAFRGHHCKVEAVVADKRYYWGPCLPAVSIP